MAPYVPQNAHYVHLDVCEYLHEDLYAFVGRGGRRFYRLTRELGLQYLWFNPENKVIECWGSYEAMKLNPVPRLREALEKFVSQRLVGHEDVDPNKQSTNGEPQTDSHA
jgi:hypothetical protein